MTKEFRSPRRRGFIEMDAVPWIGGALRLRPVGFRHPSSFGSRALSAV